MLFFLLPASASVLPVHLSACVLVCLKRLLDGHALHLQQAIIACQPCEKPSLQDKTFGFQHIHDVQTSHFIVVYSVSSTPASQEVQNRL